MCKPLEHAMTHTISRGYTFSRVAAAVIFAAGLMVQLSFATPAAASGKKSNHVASSGVAFGSGYSVRKHDHYHNHRHLKRHRKARISGKYHSGVRLAHKRRHYRNRDYLLVERRRQIEARNRAVAAQDLAKRRIRAGIVATPVAPYQEKRRITLGGTSNIVESQGRLCPEGHNCGYRLYEDGTGPRIIILGAGSSGVDQAYDGINGPKVITLD